MTLKFNRVRACCQNMQNIIKLSAAVHELSCQQTFLPYLATVKNLKICSFDLDLWVIAQTEKKLTKTIQSTATVRTVTSLTPDKIMTIRKDGFSQYCRLQHCSSSEQNRRQTSAVSCTGRKHNDLPSLPGPPASWRPRNSPAPSSRAQRHWRWVTSLFDLDFHWANSLSGSSV